MNKAGSCVVSRVDLRTLSGYFADSKKEELWHNGHIAIVPHCPFTTLLRMFFEMPTGIGWVHHLSLLNFSRLGPVCSGQAALLLRRRYRNCFNQPEDYAGSATDHCKRFLIFFVSVFLLWLSYLFYIFHFLFTTLFSFSLFSFLLRSVKISLSNRQCDQSPSLVWASFD